MEDQLWRWTATELAAAIRTRKISSREALESCLERLDEVNPAINAVVDDLRNEARAASDAADLAVKNGEALGILHGVPVTVKINIDFAGRATTNGVVAFKDFIAREDSASVANLRQAGAVIFGRTNVPGFSTRYFTDNALHGRTLNPRNPALTPGGSSGGAAAAVAAGIGPLAHGNDRAGSVRYPAYACGVAGLRASIGRVPDFNPSSTEERGISSQLTTVNGPLARTVADVRLGYDALRRPDLRDPWCVPAKFDIGRVARPRAAAVFTAVAGADVHPDVAAAVRKSVNWLEAAGYRIEEAEPPHFTEAATLFWSLLMAEERGASPEEKAASSSGIEKFGDEAVKRARASTRAYAGELDYTAYVRGLARRTTILREWQLFFEKYAVLVMPVSLQPPFPVDHDQQGDAAMAQMLDSFHPMLAVSILGLPGLSVPVSCDGNTPIGVQIVGPRFGEELCFEAGEIIEAQYSARLPIDPNI
jgi:amidase